MVFVKFVRAATEGRLHVTVIMVESKSSVNILVALRLASSSCCSQMDDGDWVIEIHLLSRSRGAISMEDIHEQQMGLDLLET